MTRFIIPKDPVAILKISSNYKYQTKEVLQWVRTGVENESLTSNDISQEKNHINISWYTRHDKIPRDFRRYGWKAISSVRS